MACQSAGAFSNWSKKREPRCTELRHFSTNVESYPLGQLWISNGAATFPTTYPHDLSFVSYMLP